MKIIYVATGLELGDIHPEQKEVMYTLWSNMSDASLAVLGLKRVNDDGSPITSPPSELDK